MELKQVNVEVLDSTIQYVLEFLILNLNLLQKYSDHFVIFLRNLFKNIG